MLISIVIILFIVLLLLIRKNSNLKNDLIKYEPIIDIDKEVNDREKMLNSIRLEIEKLKEELKATDEEVDISKEGLSEVSRKYVAAKEELEFLQRDIEAEKELVEDYGFEKFKFEFNDSESYKNKIKEEKEKQKALIKGDNACDRLFELTFNNSKSEGKKVQTQAKKMIIRTFNGEVDDVIKKLTFRNIETSENKIKKSFEALNKLNDKGNGIRISDLYLDSKLRELELVYGKRVKEQEEKELIQEEKEILKEQKAAEQEIKRELKRQEEERKKKEKEISLREEIIRQVTEKLGVDNEIAEKAKIEIEKLKIELQEILGKEQAISQAQITSAGYVYIISNIGSFGENVFKIGLTRRLEPEQRVRELSSASVPFPYNCHGMIWSLNAVELECKLHDYFDKKRLNKVNRRKEFFKVSLDEIKKVVYDIDSEVELIEDVEAEEYYQSLAMERRSLELEQS